MEVSKLTVVCNENSLNVRVYAELLFSKFKIETDRTFFPNRFEINELVDESLFDVFNSLFQNERVEYDAVQYFADAGLGSDDVVMTDDQQKLIKVIYLVEIQSGKRRL
jgi:hypothetical protein